MQELNHLKAEHYSLKTENTKTTEKLTHELQNNVNGEYIKNVLMSYFMTNDITVQNNLIRVVFQAMKFTEEEQNKVIEAHTSNNQGVFSRALGGLF